MELLSVPYEVMYDPECQGTPKLTSGKTEWACKVRSTGGTEYVLNVVRRKTSAEPLSLFLCRVDNEELFFKNRWTFRSPLVAMSESEIKSLRTLIDHEDVIYKHSVRRNHVHVLTMTLQGWKSVE